jgi:NAD(P)-dependent dehydrogenase (short-subunit alcohol dehydrogenase family)
MNLSGRTALVTGASRGIGAGIAVALDAAGARVALVARSRDRLDALASTLTNEPVVIDADLGVPSRAGDVAARAVDALGGLDILVNNAATAVRRPTTTMDLETIDTILDLNVKTPLLLIAALIPTLQQSGHASIVNLSSVSGLVGTPNRAAYAASKGAIDAMTRSLANELGPSGIRVNSVAPGVVDTYLWERNKAIPGVVESINELTPLRRWAQADDIADVVVFLASDAARFVTGETIAADGGMGKTMNLYGGDV